MNEFDDLIARLGSLGSADVDDTVAQSHLASLASVPAPVPQYRSRARTLVAGALVAGALAGSATVAGALTGSLPKPAQEKVSTALGKVGIDVPTGKSAEAKAKAADAKAQRQAESDGSSTGEAGAGGTDRFLGDATTPCTLPDGSAFIGSHGEYVAAHPDDPATADVDERAVAAQSPCGKPIQAVEGHGGGKPDHAGKPDTAGKPAHTGPADTGKRADTGKPTTTTTTVDDDAGSDGDGDAGSTGTGKPTTGSGKPSR